MRKIIEMTIPAQLKVEKSELVNAIYLYIMQTENLLELKLHLGFLDPATTWNDLMELKTLKVLEAGVSEENFIDIMIKAIPKTEELFFLLCIFICDSFERNR